MSIHRQHTSPRLNKLAAAVAWGLLPLVSQAVSVGISPKSGAPVVNPFTGQEATVWKLVGGGGGGCTAYMITPKWVMTANHCAGTFSQGFVNDHLAPGSNAPTMFDQTVDLPGKPGWKVCVNVMDYVSPTDPTQQDATDMFICRLAEPVAAAFASAGPFPPLVAGPVRGLPSPTQPTYGQLADRSAKWGSLMLYGRAGPDLLNFVNFSGVPYNYSPITDPLGATIPELTGGDSGGAIFSFSPTTGQPAFAGITTHPLQFFSEGSIRFIQEHIAAYGDTPPASVTTTSQYGSPTARSAADLKTPPTGATVSNGSFPVRWTAPSDSSVTSYAVSYGHGGVITGRATVAASSTKLFAVPVGTSPSGVWTACVQPVNANGPGNLAWVSDRFPGQKSWYTPNCLTFDLTPPVVAPVSITAVKNVWTGLFKMSATWLTATGGAPVSTYQVKVSSTSPKGTVTTATKTVSTLSWSTNVSAGTNVCVSVAAVSSTGVTGPGSANQCKKAQ
jgi:hypothetical protein